MSDSNYELAGQPPENSARTAEQLAGRINLLLAGAEILARGVGRPHSTSRYKYRRDLRLCAAEVLCGNPDLICDWGAEEGAEIAQR